MRQINDIEIKTFWSDERNRAYVTVTGKQSRRSYTVVVWGENGIVWAFAVLRALVKLGAFKHNQPYKVRGQSWQKKTSH